MSTKIKDILIKGLLNESVNVIMNDGGDCRIAPATPGLLKINIKEKRKKLVIIFFK